MKWKLAGTYVSACTCPTTTHWPIDGSMSDTTGACTSCSVFAVDGSFSDIGLSGIHFAIYNYFPQRLSEGEWVVGLVVGEGATDDQAQSIERIVTGAAGGPFATTKDMVGEYLGMDVAKVELILGERVAASVDGRTTFRYEPVYKPDGSIVEGANAMFPFAHDFRVGKAEGRSMAYGVGFDANHSELANFAFTDESMGVETGFGFKG